MDMSCFQVRVEAMHHLLQFPVGDLVAMETWCQLKPVLSEALTDSNTTLSVSQVVSCDVI